MTLTPKQAYDRCFATLRAKADNVGYCLTVHGSMKPRNSGPSDLDLLAIPWRENACSTEQFVDLIFKTLIELLPHPARGAGAVHWDEDGCKGVPKPHGRRAWGIYITRTLYIDLSVIGERS